MDRNISKMEMLLKSSKERLIEHLKMYVKLMRSKEVELNVYDLFKHLICWDSQCKHDKRNWVILEWLESYHKTYTNANITKTEVTNGTV